MWKKNRQHLSLIDQQQQTNKTSLSQTGLAASGQGSQSNVVNTVLFDLYDSYEMENKTSDKPQSNESDLDDANLNVCLINYSKFIFNSANLFSRH
jgi:hypothetical protein